ncbi:MAG: ModD protein [Pseudomonadota bacterium]
MVHPAAPAASPDSTLLSTVADASCVLSDAELALLLADDVPHGDLTTAALGIGQKPGRLSCRARQPMTLCGVEEAVRLLILAGCAARPLAASGDALAADAPILEAAGSAAALHRAWKSAQVLLEWSSGLASAAAELVAAAAPLPVACTRKTPPGSKALAVKAMRCGGAVMHRLGLSESLLLFAEHRRFLAEPPAATVARLHGALPEHKLAVEVYSAEEALVWARAGAEILQLEKFTPAAVAACRDLLASHELHPILAAAGGIHPGNAAAYAASGARLLVSSWPYSARPRDVAVSLAPV